MLTSCSRDNILRVDERHVQIAREQQEVTNSTSALNKHVANDCFFSSDPEILFCDIQLLPHSSKVTYYVVSSALIWNCW